VAGDVRELRNYVERCVAMQETVPAEEGESVVGLDVDAKLPLSVARERCMRSFERAYVNALLTEHDGNVSAAARAAGVDRTSVHRLIARCGLRARDKSE
jgi:DNA-binding NtrC family response regulator